MIAEGSTRVRTAILSSGVLGISLFLLFTAHAAGLDFGVGSFESTLFDAWIYDSVMLLSALACLLRAGTVPRERLAWSCIGLGLMVFCSGEVYYSLALAQAASVSIPSLADAGYFAFYALTYVGLIALLRERISSFPAARWLDGLIVGSTVAALAAALAFGPIFRAGDEGSALAVATNLAYPIADLAMLALVATAAAFTDWRPGGSWAALAMGFAILAFSDVIYLLQSAQGAYTEGGLLDACWPLGALLIAVAAWIGPNDRRASERRAARMIAIPAIAAIFAIGIQGAERFTAVPTLAASLSLLSLVVVVVRLALSLRESRNEVLVRLDESQTDPLTGLPNRRALLRDMEQRIGGSIGEGRAHLLVLFDLDGFKLYNDTFGHPAGDALLEKLGIELGRFEPGCAYRLGGDEFCLLAECPVEQVNEIIARALEALSVHGQGFSISASQGSVLLPDEASSVEGALQLADRRMYASKVTERASAGSQSRDVLLTALRERQPELAERAVDVAELALAVAETLGMAAEQRDETYRAAQLHEVGKMAIPDAILRKPGPLEDSDWAFVRKHTLIGERIIASAAALVPVARLVRASGERWDGNGYPDSLRGEQIPLGARVVAVCAAYGAMVSERAHSVAMGPSQALEELRRGAGTQFDPHVVMAFEQAVARERRGPFESAVST